MKLSLLIACILCLAWPPLLMGLFIVGVWMNSRPSQNGKQYYLNIRL